MDHMHLVALQLAIGFALLLIPSSSSADPQVIDPSASQSSKGTPEKEDRSGFVDAARKWADEHKIIERLNGDVDGWYPRLGGMTRGSGLALGPGYRTHLFNSPIRADVSVGLSTKAYKTVDARVRWINGPVELWTEYRFEDYPQEDFFGVGLSSSLATRTSYDLDTNDISLRGLVKLGDSLRIGTKVGYMSPQVGPGRDRNFPSIERFFTDAEAPGLAAQPNFLHMALFTDVDYRDQRGNAREGGLYRASFGVWDDRTLQQFDFRRLDAQAVHYVPVAPSKKHVVSGQVGLSYVNNKSGNRVPFYFLPYVGGMDSIRSYRDFRFKDENALWINLEYKWTVITYLSLATFFDVGEVQRHWEEIGFGGLKRGYGFGVRFHTPQLDLGRIDVGTGGGEGWRAFVKLGPSF